MTGRKKVVNSIKQERYNHIKIQKGDTVKVAEETRNKAIKKIINNRSKSIHFKGCYIRLYKSR